MDLKQRAREIAMRCCNTALDVFECSQLIEAALREAMAVDGSGEQAETGMFSAGLPEWVRELQRRNGELEAENSQLRAQRDEQADGALERNLDL